MPTYLEDHPPKVRQFRKPRRSQPSGLIVMHTAESILDTVGPDTGAGGVARFIASRADYGSYHFIVDSDSIVPLVPLDAEAYGDGTGSNPFAIHVSFACHAVDWPRMTAEKQAAFLANGAKAAALAAQWVQDVHGIEVPPARVSRAESERREPGFISHGERDPGRRSDPGVDFPWAQFMRAFVDAQTDEDREIRKRLNAAMREVKALEPLVRKKPRQRFWRNKVQKALSKMRQISRDKP